MREFKNDMAGAAPYTLLGLCKFVKYEGSNVTGGVFHVSTKDMADLYEYWCFIKLNSILRESGYTLDSQDFVKVKRNGIAVTLVSGKSSRIRYITDKGEQIELYYDPEYDRKKDQSSSDSKRGQVATTSQKPYNVLSLRKRVAGGNRGVVSGGAGVGSGVGVSRVGGSVAGGGAVGAGRTLTRSGAGASGAVANGSGNERCYEYVFDAKYRIGADEVYLQKHHNLPGPKEEDINTMHRYRDAIVYSADKRAAQGANYPGSFDRTMFGAYVLFPYADEKKYEKHDFYKSIETVNVGGLPFLPSATKMVRDFLEELIADSPETAFERATLPSGIEEKLARVDWSHRDVLIVKVQNQAAMDACLAGISLIVPESEIAMEHLPIHHVALYQPAVGIERFGTVLLTQEDVAGNYIFKVARWHKLAQPIGVGEFGVGSVAYTNMFLLTHGEKYPDLHLRSEAEYRLYAELKRRVKEVAYSVTTSGFEFEGKRIELADGEIVIMDGKNSSDPIAVAEFMRRPGTEFRRMMVVMKKWEK